MSKQNTRPPFHLAFPVRDLSEARNFYGELLGCPEGRSSDQWIDFDFYGHQIVTHLAPEECGSTGTSSVDAHNVPVRHFGAVLAMGAWESLADRLRKAGTKCVIQPLDHFKDHVGETPTHF